jgi:hypothetical protein
VDAVSWDTRIDGDLVCAQAKYHARSSKTFVLSLLRLSLLPLIALCCWIVANRSFRMRLKKTMRCSIGQIQADVSRCT